MGPRLPRQRDHAGLRLGQIEEEFHFDRNFCLSYHFWHLPHDSFSFSAQTILLKIFFAEEDDAKKQNLISLFKLFLFIIILP